MTDFACACQEPACCPACARPSAQIHSRYRRRLADLPWTDRALMLELEVRRFYCANGECRRRTFSGSPGGFAGRHRRRTTRLQERLQRIGLRVGGPPGVRLVHGRGPAVWPADV